jgi:hypothetical protein
MADHSAGRFGIVWLGLVLVFAAWAFRTSHGVVDVDLWHELSLARETAKLGSVPQTDSFAYTPTIAPVVNHEWGAGAIGYLALHFMGAPGIVALTFGTLAGACLFAAVCAWKQQADERILALAGILVAPLFTIAFPPVRAEAYSLVFFGSLLCAIEFDRRGLRWALPAWCPVYVMWANCHASFVLAFIFLGVYWLSAVWERRRNIHILGLIAFLVGLIAINPYGLAMYPFLWRTLRMSRSAVEEWVPVWHGRFAPLLRPIFMSLALVLYGVWRRRGEFLSRTASMQPAATILLVAAAGVIHVKLLPYFAVAFLAYFPGLIGPVDLGREITSILTANRKAARATWAAVMLAAMIVFVLLRAWTLHVPDHGDFESVYPVGAVNYLARQNVKARVMTPFNEGAYVSWKLFPRIRVSMDSRYDVAFPEWLIPLNESAYGTGNWRAFVDRYPTDMILARRNSPMEAALIQSSLADPWKRVYGDGAYSLFARPGLDLPVVDLGSQTFEGTLP